MTSILTYITKFFKKKKESEIWLKVPTNHKTHDEALQCFYTTIKLLEQKMLKNY